MKQIKVKKINIQELEYPTIELIEKYIEKFNNNKRYFSADRAILNLINSFPDNVKIEDVFLKVSVINALYSTNILDIFKIAEHILRLDIDTDLKKGNPEIIYSISHNHNICSKKNNTEYNLYSFATKYCNWHNRKNYPIYDSFVSKVLIGYKTKYAFSSFNNNDLKDFVIFKRVIADYICHFKLTKYSLIEIDKFLWQYGKDVFKTD